MPLTELPRFRLLRLSRAQWVRCGTAALYAGVVILFLVSIGRYYHRNTGFTTLIHFGDQFSDRVLPVVRYTRHAPSREELGGDGQFYAQIALEPLLRNRQIDRALDFPPYRARRVLFSWSAYLLGFGQPERVLKVYAMQNIVAWLVLALALLRWLPPSRPRNLLPWIGCLYSAGMLISVQFSMLDGLSLLLLTLAILAQERQCGWLATGMMAISGLGRETNLIGSGLLVSRMPHTRRDFAVLGGTALCVVMPFFLWTRYLAHLYPDFSYSNSDLVGVPFAGYLAKMSATLSDFHRFGWHSDVRFEIVMLVALSVQLVFVALRWDWKSAWWRMAAPYCLLFAITGYGVWGPPGGAPRVLLPLTVAFNVLVTRLEGPGFWVLVVLGNLSVVTGIAMIEMPWVSTLF